jgi:hypothetical protein
LGDLNGTGGSDIVVQNVSGQMWLFDMSANNITGGGNIGNFGADWHVAAVADLNGDGKADIVLQNTSGQMWDLQMNGNNVAGGGNIGNYGADWRVRGVANFNDGGLTDIVLQNTGCDIFTLPMNANNVVAGGSNLGNPGIDWKVRQVGDFSGTGQNEIVLQNTTTGQIFLWTAGGGAGSGNVGNFGAGWWVPFTTAGGWAVEAPPPGSQTLTAQPSVFNLFAFDHVAFGHDTIAGFDPSRDAIELSSAQAANFAAVQGEMTASGGGTLITLSPSQSIFVQGVAPASLTASNFRLS